MRSPKMLAFCVGSVSDEIWGRKGFDGDCEAE